MESTTQPMPWSSGKKITFRFLFIYFLLYTFPFPLEVFSFAADFNLSTLWSPLVIWSGKNILKLDYEITVLPNGSGDTTWNYVQVFIFSSLSALGTLLWSLADQKRVQFDRLFFWLIVLLRYYLAVTLIHYGFAKIIKTQFPFPYMDRLFQTYGESSPMGLLWTFMGYSTAYNFFTGTCEAVAGFLLFFKHTKILGAFLSIAVMSNIVMLNFSYDVPVKLFSLHLLFMSFFLLVPDWQRLLNFFILNKTTASESIESVFQENKRRLVHGVGKAAFIIFVLATDVLYGLKNHRQLEGRSGNSAFNGIYEVETHVINQDTIPPLLNDTKRWKRLFVNWNDFLRNDLISIEYMDNAKIYWRFSPDTLKHNMRIMSYDSGTVYSFHYQKEGNTYFLRGTLYSDSIRITMKKVSNDFPLISRGFHWINEYPFNH